MKLITIEVTDQFHKDFKNYCEKHKTNMSKFLRGKMYEAMRKEAELNL